MSYILTISSGLFLSYFLYNKEFYLFLLNKIVKEYKNKINIIKNNKKIEKKYINELYCKTYSLYIVKSK